ncbi:MAG: hypothetical protein NC342_01900 [Pseudoflavonifractor sp.]|nr:hypothetical protein [Alloprevotella sp.]MCM1116277.1 hypothetical protein [Pseudoflavonifractor sp.]
MNFTDNKKLMTGAAILVALLLIVVGISIWQMTSLKMQVNAERAANEQLQLTNEQLSLSNEFEAINSQFAQYEDQANMMANDTIMAKYAAAKNKIEELLKELNSEKAKSSAQIKKLKDEIATLRALLKHYVAQVDSLNKENAALRDENSSLSNRNQQLASQVSTVEKQNKNLSERMTLAEKLNVTGVTLTPLKGNGKTEKNVTKARQLMVSFTIPQNNSTPVGPKTVYLRITSPEGTLLGGAGSFSFEGGSIPYTEKLSFDYGGEEIGGLKIYWNVNTALTPGDYTVELFADNYRLASRHFTLKK